MKQRRNRHIGYAAAVLLFCLLSLCPFGTKYTTMTAQAATSNIRFASSIASKAQRYAEKAGATSASQIAIAKVMNYTNVFAKRSIYSSVRGRLYRGTGAYILKTKGNFCYVSSGKVKGWVKKSVLLTGTAGIRLMASMNPRIATVKASDLNVRESATTSSAVVVNLAKGEKVIVTSVSGKWAKVRITDNNSGYIYRSYASIQKGLYMGTTISAENKMKKRIAASQSGSVAASSSSSSGSSSVSGKWVSLGNFKLTAYCPCSQCSGSWGRQTASGNTAKAKHTIAVDKSVIPLGSKIRIGNSSTVYVAEDVGVSGKTIDIFFDSHSETRSFGVQHAEVYILK